jgi:HSP20 family protein
MGETWAPVIDPNHFLGRSAFDIPYPKSEKAPAASLVKEGDLLVLEVKVPDYRKEHLEVEVNNDLLFIRGNKEEKLKTVESEHVAQELQWDNFERIFKLAPAIAREGVKAELKKGVLRIKFYDVPTEEETVHRKVTIQ